jgi:plastocyanin
VVTGDPPAPLAVAVVDVAEPARRAIPDTAAVAAPGVGAGDGFGGRRRLGRVIGVAELAHPANVGGSAGALGTVNPPLASPGPYDRPMRTRTKTPGHVPSTRYLIGFVLVAGLVASCASGDDDAPSASALTSTVVSPPRSSDAAATTAADASVAPTTDQQTTLPQTTVAVSTTTTVAETPARDGSQHMHFEVGPIDVQPGQNNIDFEGGIPQPDVDGWITRMQPDLRFDDGSVPPVDVIHLHHGVWLNTSARDSTAGLPERFLAAGEEKTINIFPAPYAYGYSTTDHWTLNYMLHNLTDDPKQVWITYDIDFIPADSPAASGVVAARPIWMDVQNGSVYPVFDVVKGAGGDGQYTYPTEAADPYAGGPNKNEWTVDRDGVLFATAGHLHPGGLHTDLLATRDGRTATLFRSEAKYFEPAGAVSWDVAMTATTPDWAVAVRAGDVLSTTATYDSALASWYESMGIMVVWMADPPPAEAGVTALDPFVTDVSVPGMLTHGHLPENDNHGGAPAADDYLDLTVLPSEAVTDAIKIQDYGYAQGDMSFAAAVPTVAPGGTITYDNLDAPYLNGQWHTITSCRAPCNASTGIAYPIADGDIPFDSGELGLGGPPTANRVTWTTPADLPEGTYTYFCRIHPVMRGAFRIDDDAPAAGG